MSKSHNSKALILIMLLWSFLMGPVDSIICTRPAAGSYVAEPSHYYSTAGILNIKLFYQRITNSQGVEEDCISTQDGIRSPTLHLIPGGRLTLTLVNLMQGNPTVGLEMNPSATNLHFHGMLVSPKTVQDNVYITVDPGTTFIYQIDIPPSHPAGLFYYHPHMHGTAERSVLAGASGLIIVDGIESHAPLLAGLPMRTITFRDEVIPGVSPGYRRDAPPAWDLSLNFIPIHYPQYIPTQITMAPNTKEFWRIAHTGADSSINLQLLYDGVPQIFQIVAYDGVVVNAAQGYIEKTNLFLSCANRVEVIVRAPSVSVKVATLITLETAPIFAPVYLPQRTLATIHTFVNAPGPSLRMASIFPPPPPPGIIPVPMMSHINPVQVRTLVFSEVFAQFGPPAYFITVDGAQPKQFSMADPPAIYTRQGNVEDWIVINQGSTPHMFHIHQTHFLLLQVNGASVSATDMQYYDTYQADPFTGTGAYPSIRVRMDFTAVDVGIFPYHCHILGHEDLGMMAMIQVLAPGAPIPSTTAAASTNTAASTNASSNVHSLGLLAQGGLIGGIILVNALFFTLAWRRWRRSPFRKGESCSKVIPELEAGVAVSVEESPPHTIRKGIFPELHVFRLLAESDAQDSKTPKPIITPTAGASLCFSLARLSPGVPHTFSSTAEGDSHAAAEIAGAVAVTSLQS